MVLAAPAVAGRANGRQAPPRPTRPFRRDIEGLRAVAVIAVVLGHAGAPFMRGGYVGVDVFLVISGFLITSYLWQEAATTGRVGIGAFYARRALRLLPAAVLVIAVTLLATWLWLPASRLRSVALDAVTAAAYGLNIRLAAQGADYFAADGALSPLRHLWTLAVEEQFYLLWPVLLAASAIWFGRRPRHGRPAHRWWPAVAVAGLLAIASFATAVAQTVSSPSWAFFGPAARIWELAVGALLALCAHRLSALPRAATSTLSWSGLAAVVASAVLYTEATPYPGLAALVPVAGTAAVIAAGCARTDSGVQRALSSGLGQGIGRLSYSWYLWHWPVLVIAPVLFGLELRTGQGVVLAIWSLVLAAVTYLVVEDPVRTGRWLRSRPAHGLTLGAGLSAGLAGVALATAFLAPPSAAGRAPDTRVRLAAGEALPELIATAARTGELPANLRPSLAAADGDRPLSYADGCDLALTQYVISRLCEYGDRSSPTRVVLFGDSHAGHWFPALHRLAEQRHWRLFVATKSACSAASVLIHLPALKRPYTECATWHRDVVARIRDLRPALVVMSSHGAGGTPLQITDPGAAPGAASGGDAAPGAASGGDASSGDVDRVWTAAWLATARQLRSAGTRLVVISDTPRPVRGALGCLSAHPHDVGRCARPADRAVSETRRRAMVADALTRAGVTVIDPVPWFCTASVCPVVVGDTLVYKDGSHMTTAYAEALAPVLGARLPALD